MTRLNLAHLSLQFSDTGDQMRHDVRVLFDRGYHVITGTESGPDNPLHHLVAVAAKVHGYRLQQARTNWVAFREDIIRGGWSTGYVDVLQSTEGIGKHSDRGIVWAGANTTLDDVGRVTVGCGHYLTKGRRGQPNNDENRRYAAAIGDWARDKGAGGKVVFYHGDQNTIDRDVDTFYGEPLTSAWDELQVWQDTGHGNIDVIASYDPDRRVRARRVRALPDRRVFLNTDHFLIEATYDIGAKR